MKFTYYNPVKIRFGVDYLEAIKSVANHLQGARFLLVTSKGFSKRGLSDKIANALGTQFVGIVDEILPNPQLKHLQGIKYALADFDAIIALGGGSVIDSAKFLISNSSLTQFLRELEKSAFDRQSVLSQADFSAQPTNLTQDTRIAEDSNDSSLRDSQRESKQSTKNQNANSSIVSEKSGLCSHEQGNKTDLSIDEASGKLPDLSPQDEFAQNPILAPATPLGIMELLKAYDISVSGKNVAIIGASNIVGKPLTALMLNAGATISVCHILTKDISVFTKSADIVCVGVGKANLITTDMIKNGAIVIDIGINKVDGKIKGDVDFEAVAKKASFITPVPGGVGPMTIAMLLKNTLLCAQILHESTANQKHKGQK